VRKRIRGRNQPGKRRTRKPSPSTEAWASLFAGKEKFTTSLTKGKGSHSNLQFQRTDTLTRERKLYSTQGEPCCKSNSEGEREKFSTSNRKGEITLLRRRLSPPSPRGLVFPIRRGKVPISPWMRNILGGSIY